MVFVIAGWGNKISHEMNLLVMGREAIEGGEFVVVLLAEQRESMSEYNRQRLQQRLDNLFY